MGIPKEFKGGLYIQSIEETVYGKVYRYVSKRRSLKSRTLCDSNSPSIESVLRYGNSYANFEAHTKNEFSSPPGR
jgi:hypothetical protein